MANAKAQRPASVTRTTREPVGGSEWIDAYLGDVAEIISGQHVLASLVNEDGRGVPYLTGPSDFVGQRPHATKWTTSPAAVCEAGDLLITVKGSGCGSIAMADRQYAISRQLMAIRAKEIEPGFLRPLVPFLVSMNQLIPSGTIPQFTREELKALPTKIPPRRQQMRIAEMLSTWDETLERLSRQIERKTKVFSSLHETLITGRRRLRGWSSKWSLVPIGRFLAPVRRPVPKPAEPYRALSIRSHGKGTFQRLVDRPDTVEMDTLYRVGARDLIVNITFAWEGAIALANREDEGCLVSHRFPTFAIDENVVDRDFLGYAVNNRRFFHQLGIVSPGGAGRNRVLNQRDFLEIEIACPSLDEQHAIARVLLDSQREIAALEAERAALAKQRDALATELLTGRLRVPQAEAAS